MRWLLLDRIDELVPGQSAVGHKVFPGSLGLFEDHFPSFPVVPGVLLTEAMAQLAGKLIGYTVRKERGDWPFPILSMANNLKFRKFVRPDEEVRLEVKLTSLRDEMAAVDVRCGVGSQRNATGELIFVFNAVPLADPADAAKLELLERTHLRQLWAAYPPEEP